MALREPEVRPGKITVLNGVSSSGKSTLSRKLQELSPEPLFHVALDAFLNMLPNVSDEPEEVRWKVHLGGVEALHVTAGWLSRLGYSVVIDTVLWRPEWLEDCVAKLAECPVLYVGVHCPPEELARRERARGDRRIGQAVEQLSHVHTNALCDVEVDTHAEDLQACAQRVIAALQHPGRHEAGRRMRERFALQSRDDANLEAR